MKIFKISMAVIAISALAGLFNVATAQIHEHMTARLINDTKTHEHMTARLINETKKHEHMTARLINNTGKTLYLISYGTKHHHSSWAITPPKKLLPGQSFTMRIEQVYSGYTAHINMYFTYAIKGGSSSCYVKLGSRLGAHEDSTWKATAEKSRCSTGSSLQVRITRQKDGLTNTVTFYPKKIK